MRTVKLVCKFGVRRNMSEMLERKFSKTFGHVIRISKELMSKAVY